MKRPIFILPVIGAALVAAPAEAVVVSENQQAYLQACNAKPSCRMAARDDGIVFVFVKNGHTYRMLCKEDGSCFLLGPRGRRDKISGLEFLGTN